MMLAYRDQARVFKALAHPVRLRILYALPWMKGTSGVQTKREGNK